MAKRRALFLVSFFTALTLSANAQDTLQNGIPIERALGPHQVHNFTVNLEENTLIQFVVEQHGIDVIVKMASPTGKSLGEYDSPNGDDGSEHVSFVALTAGKYNISVGPLNPNDATSGRYEIKLLELRRANDKEIKAAKNQELVKVKGIALLTEIEETIPQIKSPQTRIRAQLQAAQLLWDSDQKRASKCLTDAVTGVKEFLASVDPTNQRHFEQYSAVWQLRYELVQVLLQRDPDAALNFLYSTVPDGDPSGNRRNEFAQESMIELSIANQIMRDDPKRALQIARRTLSNGYSSNLVDTLSQLSVRNPELASELATEIFSKVINEKLLQNGEAATLTIGLIKFSRAPNRIAPTTSIDGQTSRPATLLTDEQYRELLQKLSSEALSYSPKPGSYSPERDALWNILAGLQSLGQELDGFVTGGAAAVEKKQAELQGANNPRSSVYEQIRKSVANDPVDVALEAIARAPEGFREQFYLQLAGREANNGDPARARQIINDNVSNLYQKRNALANIEQNEIHQSMSKGKIEDALRVIAAMRSPRDRAFQLTLITNQIGPGLKRANALNLLEQARGMLSLSPQAQDQDQMKALFEIARAILVTTPSVVLKSSNR